MAIIKGICKNIDNCSRAENRDIQEIEKSLPFICEECGKPLQEIVHNTKKKNKLLLYITPCIFVAFGSATFYICRNSFSFSGTDTTSPSLVHTKLVVTEPQPENTDSEEVDLPTEKEPKAISTVAPNQLDLGHAVWSGKIKNNRPHAAKGTMTFRTRHQIESRDEKKRTASPGDYIIGEYVDGHLVQGRWFNTDGKLIGNIIIGLP